MPRPRARCSCSWPADSRTRNFPGNYIRGRCPKRERGALFFGFLGFLGFMAVKGVEVHRADEADILSILLGGGGARVPGPGGPKLEVKREKGLTLGMRGGRELGGAEAEGIRATKKRHRELGCLMGGLVVGLCLKACLAVSALRQARDRWSNSGACTCSSCSRFMRASTW